MLWNIPWTENYRRYLIQIKINTLYATSKFIQRGHWKIERFEKVHNLFKIIREMLPFTRNTFPNKTIENF